MHWQRRRDLEGGKELGIRLLVADDVWTHESESETVAASFVRALEILEASSYSMADE